MLCKLKTDCVLVLRLELEIEPIFASLALYDIRERKKVSETFHFDLNAPYIKKLLSGHVPREDVSTLSKSCIFSVTYPTADIFLVVKVCSTRSETASISVFRMLL